MRFFRYALLALAIFFTQQAYAQEIAVLGVQQALLNTKAAAAFREKLKKDFSDDESQVVDLQKQARALRDKIQKNAGLASKDELQQQQMQFRKVFAEYQKQAQHLQEEQGKREQAFIRTMKPKLDKVVRNLIKGGKIDLIISKRATIYADDAFDITAKVTELLDKEK